jgi:hypothetical protein
MRRMLLLLTAVLLATAAAGCTHGHDSTAGPSPVHVVTGTELEALLVTDVPATFTPNADGTADSGVLPASPSTAPAAGTGDCRRLGQTGFVDLSGITGVAFAQADFQDRHQNEINEELDVYPAGDAAEVLTRLRAVFAGCARFTYDSGGSPVHAKVVTSTLAGLGDGAFEAVYTSPQLYGGQTYVVARVGDTVISTFYNDTVGGYDDGHILAFARKLVANVAAAA